MRKRLLALALTLAMVLTMLPVTALAADEHWIDAANTSWYADDSTEFTIDSAEKLAGLAKLVNEGTDFSKKTIYLGADIDLTGKEWTPIGTKTNPFKGIFDGVNGESSYTISHMTVSGTSYLGLFGVTDGATVQNLILSDVSVTGSADHVGAVAGQTKATFLTNVKVSSAVVASEVSRYGNAYAGGLTGEGYTGKIEGCVVDGLTLTTPGAFVGGISGQGYASINNCVVKNSSITTGYWKVGGIVGQLNEGNFTFTGNQVLDTTIASTSTSGSVGGIIGFSNYGNKTLTNNTVSGVTLRASTGAGGLIGSVSSQTNNNFSFTGCAVSDLTFQSEGNISNSGGLIGEKYWRGSAGTSFSADDCTVSDIKVDGADGSKAGALFGSFGTDGNTYTVTDVHVSISDSENAVSQLVGNSNLGSSTFTMSGDQTVIDAAYAGEAVDYLKDGIVLEKKPDGTYGMTEGADQVVFNRDQLSYYTSLDAAFAQAADGDSIVVVADDASASATLKTNVTLEPGSHTLPDITVQEGTNLTIAGSGTLNAALTNHGTVTVDQDTTVTSYNGDGALATNQTGKRVKFDQGKLVLYNIPYVFEINGVKYEAEEMSDMAATIGAAWDAETNTLSLGQDVSITGTIGVMTSMTLELNGYCLNWPEATNANGNPLIVTESDTTLIIQDSSTGQTGRLVADKSNVIQGMGAIILKSGTLESKASEIYYQFGSSTLDIQGGTLIAPEEQGICAEEDFDYVTIRGGSFNVLPAERAVVDGCAVVWMDGSYRTMPENQLESGIAHGAVIVTEVDGICYASLETAIDAAMSGSDKTITLRSDITVDTWTQIWNITGITLDGAGHTIKVNAIESLENHDAVFHSAGGNTFSNLTIDLSGITEASAAQGYRAFSAAPGDCFSNVKIIGNERVSYGITVGGTEVGADETITIDNCSFTDCGYGVYSDLVTNLEKLSITNSTFTDCDYASILYTENVDFTGNTVKGGKLNIMHETQNISGNTFEDGSRIKFYDAPETFVKNEISEDSHLETASGVSGVDVSENYWGGGAPSDTQIPDGTGVTGDDVYYVNDTMNPEDLNTYVPSSGGSSGYAITVSAATNGKVSVSTTRAAKGTKVTLTVKPNDGYVLDTLTVTGKDGKAVELTKDSDTKYTFTMPASAVTVKATFVDAGLPFTDVSGHWALDAIEYVYENGMMNGTTSTKFGPEAKLTRGMIVTILYRLEGEPTVSGSTFADVDPSLYYADPIAWAAKNGIVTGYDETTFGPENSITREQLAAILYRYASYKGYDVTKTADLSVYADADSVSAYAKDAMSWANAEGLITGVTTTTLNPKGTATRAQVATILMRFCESVAE